MKFSLLIAGSGGQGGMSMGMSLASSAVEGGRHATFMPLYGPEQRGGSAKCTVILSDEPIVSPLPKQSDGFIAMNEASFKKFIAELRPGGVVVRNTDRISSPLRRGDVKCVDVAADELAHGLGSDKVSGIILLGVMLGYSGMMDPNMFLSSLEHKFESKGEAVVEMNRRALNAGLELGRAAAQ